MKFISIRPDYCNHEGISLEFISKQEIEQFLKEFSIDNKLFGKTWSEEINRFKNEFNKKDWKPGMAIRLKLFDMVIFCVNDDVEL